MTLGKKLFTWNQVPIKCREKVNCYVPTIPKFSSSRCELKLKDFGLSMIVLKKFLISCRAKRTKIQTLSLSFSLWNCIIWSPGVLYEIKTLNRNVDDPEIFERRYLERFRGFQKYLKSLLLCWGSYTSCPVQKAIFPLLEDAFTF